MSYLGNDAINRVNIHSGIVALAHGAGGIFFMAVLLSAGISFPNALLAQAAMFALRFSIRPLVLPIAKRTGLKPLMVAGTLGMATQYLFLPQVDGIGTWLWVLVVSVSVSEVIYFPVYHTYFTTLGDNHARGRQIAVREAFSAVAGIVAPLLGAWAIVAGGTHLAFYGVAIVQASAVLPLIPVRNVPVLKEAPGVFKSARIGGALFALDGWLAAAWAIVWQGALFLVLDSSYAAYGGAMAFAGLVGAVYGLFIGRSIDAGRGRRAVTIAFTVFAAIIMWRALSLPWPWLAVIANAAGAMVMPLYAPVLGGATYNLARAAPCPLRFNLTLEAAWDIGCTVGLVAAAGLLTLGAPMSVVVLTALPALLAGAILLRRYYGARPV